jgi:hypothetical protein
MRKIPHTNGLSKPKHNLVGVALDRANFVRANVVVAGGLDIASTAAIADGGAIGKYKLARNSH